MRCHWSPRQTRKVVSSTHSVRFSPHESAGEASSTPQFTVSAVHSTTNVRARLNASTRNGKPLRCRRPTSCRTRVDRERTVRRNPRAPKRRRRNAPGTKCRRKPRPAPLHRACPRRCKRNRRRHRKRLSGGIQPIAAAGRAPRRCRRNCGARGRDDCSMPMCLARCSALASRTSSGSPRRPAPPRTGTRRRTPARSSREPLCRCPRRPCRRLVRSRRARRSAGCSNRRGNARCSYGIRRQARPAARDSAPRAPRRCCKRERICRPPCSAVGGSGSRADTITNLRRCFDFVLRA
jgi:hypothetical protein